MRALSSSLGRGLLLVGCELITCQASAQRFFHINNQSRTEFTPVHFPDRVLAEHNRARAGAGVVPLSWDAKLASDAAQYAAQLASSGRFSHSNRRARGGAGENLWMGTRNSFQVEEMVGGWRGEKAVFVSGVFPAVSKTGNWGDVGHYTQMVWPTTQRIGCALAANARADYLVCRYWPAGNIMGFPIQAPRLMAQLR